MYVLWIVLAFMFLFIIRTVQGPTIWDRLLGMNLASTKVILIILLLASFQDMGFLLDYAIIYALSGFIGTLFITMFWGTRKQREKEKRDGTDQ